MLPNDEQVRSKKCRSFVCSNIIMILIKLSAFIGSNCNNNYSAWNGEFQILIMTIQIKPWYPHCRREYHCQVLLIWSALYCNERVRHLAEVCNSGMIKLINHLGHQDAPCCIYAFHPNEALWMVTC